jgi:hypothetical protein
MMDLFKGERHSFRESQKDAGFLRQGAEHLYNYIFGSELKVMLKQFLSFQIVMSNEIFDGFSVKPIAL